MGNSEWMDSFRKSSIEKRNVTKLLEEAGESAVIKEMVTKLSYAPVQPLEKRYEYVRISQEEGNFEFFEKISNLLAEKFKYSVYDSDPDDELCCEYFGNNAYDFEVILLLARFYQNNRNLFDGHFDIISRMCESNENFGIFWSNWDKIKEFWLNHTIATHKS